MKWFDKWFAKKCKQAWEKSENEPEGLVGLTRANSTVRLERSIDSHGMNFSVYKANGGYIVEYRQYDKRHDRSDNKLHIVTEDKNLGEELGKIITFEALRS